MWSCAGVLLICLNVDYRVLFTPLDEDVLRDAFEFYTTFYKSPPAIKVRTRVESVFFSPSTHPFVRPLPLFASSMLRTQPWLGLGLTPFLPASRLSSSSLSFPSLFS